MGNTQSIPPLSKLCGGEKILAVRSCRFNQMFPKYSKGQIRKIVGELQKLNQDAARWKNEFDTLVKEVKDERRKKEAERSGLEAKIASDFGKYGNEQFANNRQYVNSGPSATSEQKLYWITQGRCAYCGGKFKGLFSKACCSCGKTKNYR